MIAALAALVLALLVTLVLPIWSFLRARQALQRTEQLEGQLRELSARLDRLAGIESPVPAAPPPRPSVTAVPVAARPGIRPSTNEAPPPAPVASSDPHTRQDLAGPDSLETRIGTRWLLYVGVAAVVVATGFFVKYAFDNEWVTPVTRIVIGAVGGLVLVVVGDRFARAGYALYGQMLQGGGIAVLYVAIYAAFNFYSLVGRPAAFALMALVTAAAAWLANRARSQGLALAGICGGFATPFLVGADAGSEVALFGYDLVLVAGTLVLARLRKWPTLNLASYVLTVVTISEWADQYYVDSKYLVTEIFLTAFAALFVAILRESRRMPGAPAQGVTLMLWTAPVLYHLASVVILFAHSQALLIYLVATTATGLLVAGRGASARVRLVLWAAAVLPFFGWLFDRDAAAGVALPLTTIATIYALHLAAERMHLSERGGLTRAEIVLLHGNGLALLAAGTIALEARGPLTTGLYDAVLAAWHGGLGWTLRERMRPAWHQFLALAAAMLAAAVAEIFDGAWVTVAWSVEGAGITWLGLRERQGWLRTAGTALLLIAAWQHAELLRGPISTSYATLLNERTSIGILLLGLMAGLSYLYRRAGEPSTNAFPTADRWLVAANIVAVAMLTAEIDAYWELRAAGRTGYVIRQALFSTTWATYAVGLIVAGILTRNRALRYLAVGLFGITVVKVFFVDLANLDRVYQILTTLLVGLLLLVASYLYQRYVVRILDTRGGVD